MRVARRPEPELDAMLVIERLMAERQAVVRQFTRQVLLGQRRPLIGQMGLVADEHQTSAKALAAQGVDRLRAGLTATQNENRRDHGTPWNPVGRAGALPL